MSNSPYMRTQKNKFLENFKKIIKDFYLPIFRKIYIYIYIYWMYFGKMSIWHKSNKREKKKWYLACLSCFYHK